MPNITWQEPQIVTDLLALNLYASQNGLDFPGKRQVSLISPWLSNIEIMLRPGPWYQLLVMGHTEENPDLFGCLRAFLQEGWLVQLGVLQYGTNQTIPKPANKFTVERRWLRQAIGDGAEVYLVPNLHAKGIVTPLGIITGSTNITYSGMYVQSQNTNYFAHDHPDYMGNRQNLLSFFQQDYHVSAIS